MAVRLPNRCELTGFVIPDIKPREFVLCVKMDDIGFHWSAISIHRSEQEAIARAEAEWADFDWCIEEF